MCLRVTCRTSGHRVRYAVRLTLPRATEISTDIMIKIYNIISTGNVNDMALNRTVTVASVYTELTSSNIIIIATFLSLDTVVY